MSAEERLVDAEGEQLDNLFEALDGDEAGAQAGACKERAMMMDDDDMSDDEEIPAAAPVAHVDDDMTDDDVPVQPRGAQPSNETGEAATTKPMEETEVAQDPEEIKCRSVLAAIVQEAEGNKEVQEAEGIKELNVEALKKKPKAVQIAVYKAKIKELNAQKVKLMEQEDYMAAQELKKRIRENEQQLATVRGQLCASAIPTPARAPDPVASVKRPLVDSAQDETMQPQSETVDASLSLEERAMCAAVTADSEPVDASLSPEERAMCVAVTADAEEQAGMAGTDVAMKLSEWQSADALQPSISTATTEDYDQPAQLAPPKEGDQHPVLPKWRQSGTKDMIELACDESPHPFMLPTSLFERLYEYQQDGVAWLGEQWVRQQGGILADEMGLGKTVQICALLNGARKSGATHALVLLPVTLLDQWAGEARLWCPGWPVYTYYGNAFQRAEALRGISLPQGGILLTSYSMLSNTDQLFDVAVADARKQDAGRKPAKRRKQENQEAEEVETDKSGEWEVAEMPPTELPRAGENRAWDIVVCDEAHRMKSISSLFSKSVRRVKSRCRLLLTGTPLQNALQDLWALMDFAKPGILGNHKTFVKNFSDPIDKGSVRGASSYHLTLKNRLARQLRTIIGPHLLRRTKATSGLVVAEDSFGASEPDEFAEFESTQFKALPLKRETIVWLMPSDEQTAIYQKVLEASDIIREATAKSKLGIEVFRAIGLLKRLCNHPQLILPTVKPGQWKELLAEATDSLPEPAVPEDAVVPSEAPPDELAEAGLSNGSAGQVSDDARAGRSAETMARRLPRSADDLLAQSSKLRCMALLLPALAKRGHRTLIFSQSVKMLDLVQICVLKPHGLRCLRIDGQTDPSTRAQKVAKFEKQLDRFQCMLLTTGVGGVGLNLTSADRVVMIDPAWNPATDAQAVDRAYRIGQEKEVRVYRLVTSGLIEDKMFRLQVYKMGLTKTALEDGESSHLFTAREIRALFEWTDPAQGETRKLLDAGESESAVLEAARDDGADKEGWLGDWLAAGASDFGAFNRSLSIGSTTEVQGRGEEDKTVEMRVQEVKEMLSSVEEVARGFEVAHKAEEEKRTAAEQGIAEATTAVHEAIASRAAADNAIKERRGLLKAARASEGETQVWLKKALGKQIQAQEAQMKATLALHKVEDTAAVPVKAAEEARLAVQSSKGVLSKALQEAQKILQDSTWDADSGVKVYPTSMRRAQKTLDKVKAALDTLTIRQSDMEATDNELCALDLPKNLEQTTSNSKNENDTAPTTEKQEEPQSQSAASQKVLERARNLTGVERERVRKLLEQRQSKGQARADAACDAASSAVAAFVESGLAFVDAFESAGRAKNIVQGIQKKDELRAAQSTAKFVFKEFASAWAASRKAQEAWLKANYLRSKALQKCVGVQQTASDAAVALAQAQAPVTAATVAKDAQVEACQLVEQLISEAQAARERAEQDEDQSRQRRDLFKEEVASARSGIKSTRAAVKEAESERQAVLAQVKKVEKVGLRVEAAKSSALDRLRSETYDQHQVELAYDAKKRGGPNEADTQLQLKKAQSAQMQSNEVHLRASQTLKQQQETFDASSKSAEETRSAARAAEDSFSTAYSEAEAILQDPTTLEKKAQTSGWRGVVEITQESMTQAKKALEQVRNALDTTAIRQSEVEDVEDELLALTNSVEYSENERELVWNLLEKSQGEAHAHAETARESTSLAVTTFLGEALAFVGAFERNSLQTVKMDEFKAAQATVRGVFKQLSGAWTASRKAQEAWLKAASGRSKCAGKLAGGRVAVAAAAASIKEAEEALAAANKAGEDEEATARAAAQAAKAKEQDGKTKAAQKMRYSEQSSVAAAEVAEEKRSLARSAEDGLSTVFANLESLLQDTFDPDGKGTGVCANMSVAPAALRKTQKALQRVRAALDTIAIRQSEVEDVEDELLGMTACEHQLPDSAEGEYSMKEIDQVKRLLERSRVQARAHSEAARDAAAACISSFLDVGSAFADGLKNTSAKAAKFKTAQAAVTSLTKQLSDSWAASRIAQEAWLKASDARLASKQTMTVAREHAAELGATLADADTNVSTATCAQKEVSAPSKRLRSKTVDEVASKADAKADTIADSTEEVSAPSKRLRSKAADEVAPKADAKADTSVESTEERKSKRLRSKTTDASRSCEATEPLEDSSMPAPCGNFQSKRFKVKSKGFNVD